MLLRFALASKKLRDLSTIVIPQLKDNSIPAIMLEKAGIFFFSCIVLVDL